MAPRSKKQEQREVRAQALEDFAKLASLLSEHITGTLCDEDQEFLIETRPAGVPDEVLSRGPNRFRAFAEWVADESKRALVAGGPVKRETLPFFFWPDFPLKMEEGWDQNAMFHTLDKCHLYKALEPFTADKTKEELCHLMFTCAKRGALPRWGSLALRRLLAKKLPALKAWPEVEPCKDAWAIKASAFLLEEYGYHYSKRSVLDLFDLKEL